MARSKLAVTRDNVADARRAVSFHNAVVADMDHERSDLGVTLKHFRSNNDLKNAAWSYLDAASHDKANMISADRYARARYSHVKRAVADVGFVAHGWS